MIKIKFNPDAWQMAFFVVVLLILVITPKDKLEFLWNLFISLFEAVKNKDSS